LYETKTGLIGHKKNTEWQSQAQENSDGQAYIIKREIIKLKKSLDNAEEKQGPVKKPK
jgi:hypothetical protein